MLKGKHLSWGHICGLIALLGGVLFLGGTLPAEGKAVHHVAGGGDQGKAPAFTTPGTVEKTRRVENYGRLPLYFIENRGQVDRKVQFFAQGRGQRIAFTSREALLTLSQGKGKVAKIHLTPVGMQPGINVQALEPQEARFNYLLGKDQSRWRTDVPSYGAVLYREAYPGIDLKFYGNGRQLEYDLIVRPGADLSRVKFRYRGIADLKVDEEGNLAVKLPDGGALVQKNPIIYQEIDGRRVAREGRFRLLKKDGSEYGFVVAA